MKWSIKNLRGVLFAFGLLLHTSGVLPGCRKAIPDGQIPGGKIALTFDDNSIDNWYTYLSLLDSLHIKATFYISRYHSLTPLQKEKLHLIAAHGHEIAYHTTHHLDLVKLLRHRGLYFIMKEEIEKDLFLMKQDGFLLFNFAYPYGSHVGELDVTLLTEFKTLRAVCNAEDRYKSLTKHSGCNQILYGADIDQVTKFTDSEINDLINDAHAHNDYLILVAHEINTNHKFFISLERLRRIAREAKNNTLRFVTINEIAS